jgi:hypothetical protein
MFRPRLVLPANESVLKGKPRFSGMCRPRGHGTIGPPRVAKCLIQDPCNVVFLSLSRYNWLKKDKYNQVLIRIIHLMLSCNFRQDLDRTCQLVGCRYEQDP